MDLLKEVNEWVQKGYEISYDIVNQYENGYADEVKAGTMPNFTYTFYIHEIQEELWYYSVDTIADGFLKALEWLKNNSN